MRHLSFGHTKANEVHSKGLLVLTEVVGTLRKMLSIL